MGLYIKIYMKINWKGCNLYSVFLCLQNLQDFMILLLTFQIILKKYVCTWKKYLNTRIAVSIWKSFLIWFIYKSNKNDKELNNYIDRR